MKLNIACPSTGGQKIFDIDEDKKLRIFYDMRISQEVDASPLGDAFKGYILRITGGNDKDGFPMKQGVLVNHRVRLLLRPGCVGFRRGTKDGERKRRTVRGCIVGPDLSVLNLIIAKKGEAEIPGLTDKIIPRRLGPKRASKIRRLFNLTKDDDVRKFVITKTKPSKKNPAKPHTKTPKIQRLVTSRRLQQKRRRFATKKHRWVKAAAEAAAYAKLIKDRADEEKAKREVKREKRRREIKLQKMLAIRRAIRQKQSERYLERKRKAEKLAEYRKKKAEREAKGKKIVWTPELVAKRKRFVLRKRRHAWLVARKELHKARFLALRKWRREKKERKRILKAFLKPMPKAKRAKLARRRALLEKRAQTTPEIFSKKGAVKFLGKNARPYGLKAKWAKRNAKAAAEAAAAGKAEPEAKKAKQ